MRLARIVRPDDLGLVMFLVLRLTESKATVLAHSLGGTNFLDRFLEPRHRGKYDEDRTQRRQGSSATHCSCRGL